MELQRLPDGSYNISADGLGGTQRVVNVRKRGDNGVRLRVESGTFDHAHRLQMTTLDFDLTESLIEVIAAVSGLDVEVKPRVPEWKAGDVAAVRWPEATRTYLRGEDGIWHGQGPHDRFGDVFFNREWKGGCITLLVRDGKPVTQ